MKKGESKRNKILEVVEKKKDKISENKKELTIKKQEIFEQYKNNLPEYMDSRLNEFIEKVRECKSGAGLSTIEINSLIRAKNMYGIVPQYSVEELSVIFEYYQQFMVAINKITKYIPTKKNFCAFAGISTVTYNSWLNSADETRAELMRNIDDYISDTMLSAAQVKEVDNITTMFRAKSEHGMTEAVAPIVVEHKTEINMEQIQAQIAALKKGKSLKTIELTKQDYETED